MTIRYLCFLSVLSNNYIKICIKYLLTMLLLLFYSVYMSQNLANRYNLDNFEAIFENYLKNERVTSVTLKNYLYDFKHFVGWFSFYLQAKSMQEVSDVTQSTISQLLTKSAIEQYKIYLQSNGIPLSTINRRLSTIRKFCTLAILQGWLTENPAKQVENAGIQHKKMEKEDKKEEVTESNSSVLLNEYKSFLLSQQADKNNVKLIMEDIKQFIHFINL